MYESEEEFVERCRRERINPNYYKYYGEDTESYRSYSERYDSEYAQRQKCERCSNYSCYRKYR